MTSGQPRLPTWLAERFIVGPNRDALLGDLFEEYHSRSAAWYWGQVLVAIALHVLSRARAGSIARWLIVLPFAVAATALTQILLEEAEWMLIRLSPRSYDLDSLWELRSVNPIVLGCVFVLIASRVVATRKTAVAVVAFVIAFAWGVRLALLSVPDVHWYPWGFVAGLGFCLGSTSGLIVFWLRRRTMPTLAFRFRPTAWRVLWITASGLWALYLAIALLQTWADFNLRTAVSLLQLWLLPAAFTYGVIWIAVCTTRQLSIDDVRRALIKWRSQI